MKKLLFVISFMFVICACTKTQPEPLPQEPEQELESVAQELEPAQEIEPAQELEPTQEITAAAQSQETISEESACKIGKYDCWTIIQDLKETKTAPVGRAAKLMQTPQVQPNINNITKPKVNNPALEEKGLFIIFYNSFWNGGPTIYVLSNGVSISVNDSSLSKKPDYAIVAGPSIKRTIYDKEGNIISLKNRSL